MKITKALILVPALAFQWTSAVLADEVVKVPRESGAVHAEFKRLLGNYLKRFDSGVGRMALTGRSGNDECLVNFYTNPKTTFVTMNVDDGDFYSEFYIDHPTQSFRNILFQNVTTRPDGVELKVTERNGGYAILTKGNMLTVTTEGNGSKSSACQFDLAKAAFYKGQTE